MLEPCSLQPSLTHTLTRLWSPLSDGPPQVRQDRLPRLPGNVARRPVGDVRECAVAGHVRRAGLRAYRHALLTGRGERPFTQNAHSPTVRENHVDRHGRQMKAPDSLGRLQSVFHGCLQGIAAIQVRFLLKIWTYSDVQWSLAESCGQTMLLFCHSFWTSGSATFLTALIPGQVESVW